MLLYVLIYCSINYNILYLSLIDYPCMCVGSSHCIFLITVLIHKQRGGKAGKRYFKVLPIGQANWIGSNIYGVLRQNIMRISPQKDTNTKMKKKGVNRRKSSYTIHIKCYMCIYKSFLIFFSQYSVLLK